MRMPARAIVMMMIVAVRMVVCVISGVIVMMIVYMLLTVRVRMIPSMAVSFIVMMIVRMLCVRIIMRMFVSMPV